MNNNPKLRHEAVMWLKGSRDFGTGVEILSQSGFKPGVVAKLKRVGPEGPAAAERLQFLIRELISVFGGEAPEDTDAELHVFRGQEAPADEPETSSKAIMDMAERVDAEDKSIPENIAAVIREYAAAYRVREQAFTALQSLPEDNDETTMLQRKNLSEAIDTATETMETLYPYYERYLNEHHVPTDKEMKELEQQPDEGTVEAEGSDGSIIDMPVSELKNLKKSLKTKILRAGNMLEYQQETKADKPNPMPDGPKRVKYETKIKNLTKKVEDIDMILAQKG